MKVVAPLAEAVHVVLSDREYILERRAAVFLVERKDLVSVVDLVVELLYLGEAEAGLRTNSFGVSGHRWHWFFSPVQSAFYQPAHQSIISCGAIFLVSSVSRLFSL